WNVGDFPASFLAALDLAAEMLERLDEETLDVMRLKTLRLGPLHLDPQLMHAGRRHGVVGQLSALKQIQEMLLIDRPVDGLEELGLHVLLLAVLDGLHQQVAQRRSFKQFTQHVVNATAKGFPCGFQFLQQTRIDFALARVRSDEVPEMADLGLTDAVNSAEPLLDLVRVPRKVIVDHEVAALQVYT